MSSAAVPPVSDIDYVIAYICNDAANESITTDTDFDPLTVDRKFYLDHKVSIT